MTSVRPSIRVTRFDRLPADIELAMVTVIEREIALQRRLESEILRLVLIIMQCLPSDLLIDIAQAQLILLT